MPDEFAMGHPTRCVRRALPLALTSSLLLLTSPAFAQSYVGRFDVYEGFMYMNSRSLSLGESGYHIQAGMRARRWLSMGFDYSRGTGDTALTEGTLIKSLQQQYNSAVSSGVLPSSYKLAVPIGTRTETYTAGPQFPYRHFNKFTPFIRPSIGAVRESAIIRPADPITTLIVNTITTTKTLQDWKAFYGLGGGVALNFSRHFSLVVQADYVHDSLFDNILRPRNTLRVSIGPGYQFGGNVTR